MKDPQSSELNDHLEVLRSDRITPGLSHIGTISANLGRTSQRLATRCAPMINAFSQLKEPDDILGMDTGNPAATIGSVNS